MAKELPYFKFEPSAWDVGSIQMCSREDKGLFMDICSIYWQRLGHLPKRMVIQKLCGGNALALDSLCAEGVIAIESDNIRIAFLDEQLNEFEKVSEQNRKNARKRWDEKRVNTVPSDKGMRSHTERNAIAMPKEEKRIEKKRKEYSENTEKCFHECLKHFPENLHPNKTQKKKWLDTIDKLQRIDGHPPEVIVAVVEIMRNDAFWAKNFLSITKLRRSDQDGVKYIDKFAEHIKSKPQFKQYEEPVSQEEIERLMRETERFRTVHIDQS